MLPRRQHLHPIANHDIRTPPQIRHHLHAQTRDTARPLIHTPKAPERAIRLMRMLLARLWMRIGQSASRRTTRHEEVARPDADPFPGVFAVSRIAAY